MVTKRNTSIFQAIGSLILAKIHMVTKHLDNPPFRSSSSYSSKNPYGNKTNFYDKVKRYVSYSSKNPYGNKTHMKMENVTTTSYSSKNPYGNKTKILRG